MRCTVCHRPTTDMQAVENLYDYIDFRPFLPPWAGFEPCEIMPGGDGCDCLELGCVDDAAAENGVVTRFASPASCEALGASTGGCSDKHKRNLLLVCAFLFPETVCFVVVFKRSQGPCRC